MNTEKIARICHEVNRALCEAYGDTSQVAWDDAPAWQITSALAGVKWRLSNPNAPISAQHERWTEQKIADGWKYGETKDAEKKEHPCIIPFDLLPREQKTKDYLFTAVVLACGHPGE